MQPQAWDVVDVVVSKLQHLKVRQAHVKELVDNGSVEVLYMPTKQMLADPLTKPLQGKLFRVLTSAIVGNNRRMSQGCVEDSVLPVRSPLRVGQSKGRN